MDEAKFEPAPFAFSTEHEDEALEDERRRSRRSPRQRPQTNWPRIPPRTRQQMWPYPLSTVRTILPVGGANPDQPQPCVCPSHGTEYVRWIQSTLNQTQSVRLPVDGVMSPATRGALRAFQRRTGLPEDGIAGPDTEQALRGASRPAGPGARQSIDVPEADLGESYEFESSDLSAPAPLPTVRLGSRGSAVFDLQNRLAAIRLDPGSLDGIFGLPTDTAVRALQRARNLVVDGVVGAQTWAALLGTRSRGYVSRPQGIVTPAGAMRARVAQIAIQEWRRWGNGAIKETALAMRGVLEDYWQVATGAAPPARNWWEPPWSAVFISWVMYKAGAGTLFRRSAAHTTYVAAAKRNRIANNNNPFKAYRIGEIAPRQGDIVCAERARSGVTYDNVDDGRTRASHSDVVVEVRPGTLVLIGGNVKNSVGRKTVSVDASGRLGGAPYFAVVRTGP